MCTHCRYIYNHFSRRKVLVPCGKCEACKQEKALKRTNRIRCNCATGQLALFCTFTYDNKFVPYIRKSDLMTSDLDISVYRNASVRVSPKTKDYIVSDKLNEVTKVYIPLEFRTDSSVSSLRPLKKMSSDCVGVCLNSDFQKFVKRLRQNLKRLYNYEKNDFSYFYCSEYGSVTKRPHFHALFFIPSSDEEIFRCAIVASWPFALRHLTEKYVEVARNAASYVSSYVNGSSDLPESLQISLFKSKHNYSRGFGTSLDIFSLASVLEKIDRGDLSYYIKRQFDGKSTYVSVPLPSYVLNRYFPKFKGLRWLSSHELRSVLLSPARISDAVKTIENPLYGFTPEETYRIAIRLENAYQYFHEKTQLNRFDYAFYYQRCYDVYSSNTFRHSFDNIVNISDFSEFYENACSLMFGEISAPTLSDVKYFCVDPNQRKDIVINSSHLADVYYKMDKQRKVTNFIFSQNHNF